MSTVSAANARFPGEPDLDVGETRLIGEVGHTILESLEVVDRLAAVGVLGEHHQVANRRSPLRGDELGNTAGHLVPGPDDAGDAFLLSQRVFQALEPFARQLLVAFDEDGQRRQDAGREPLAGGDRGAALLALSGKPADRRDAEVDLGQSPGCEREDSEADEHHDERHRPRKRDARERSVELRARCSRPCDRRIGETLETRPEEEAAE